MSQSTCSRTEENEHGSQVGRSPNRLPRGENQGDLLIMINNVLFIFSLFFIYLTLPARGPSLHDFPSHDCDHNIGDSKNILLLALHYNVCYVLLSRLFCSDEGVNLHIDDYVDLIQI